ncbi:MAG: hypothetical protein N3I35_02400 [Clostridia bacterium]|nr:hypothetical protein [Clostridia bacterium]
MKKYVKPTLEFVELRPEERLAACVFVGRNKGRNCPLNRTAS